MARLEPYPDPGSPYAEAGFVDVALIRLPLDTRVLEKVRDALREAYPTQALIARDGPGDIPCLALGYLFQVPEAEQPVRHPGGDA